MKGHVRKYRGRWAGVVELGRDPVTGKRRQKWVYADTKKECQEKVNKLIYEIQAGIYVEPSKHSVEEYLNMWLQNYAKSNVAPSTYRSYKEIISNHISPKIGNIELSKLKPFQIQEMYTKLSETHLSSTTILYIHRILHKALEQAVKWEMIRDNPASKVDPPKKRKVQYNTWDSKTIAKALELAKGTPLYIPIVLATTTGARVGEICGLQWSNVDLEKGQISIIYTFQRIDKEWQLKPVKIDRSNRLVIIPDVVVNILRQHKLWQKKNRILFGPDYYHSDHVNTWPDGRPILTEYITKQFKKFIKKHNLPEIRFHDLRHTHATELLKAGINPKIVSERLGHSSIRITLDTYSHVLPTLQKEAAELVAQNIFGSQFEEKGGKKG